MSLPTPDALYPPCGISLMTGMWSLIHTQPAAMPAAARWARKTSLVQAEAVRP
jgi:hypothetical protein